MKALNINGKNYISAKRASEITGYTRDYIGQLCHAKKVEAELVGRNWYISELEIIKHKNTHLPKNLNNTSEIEENIVKGESFTKVTESINAERKKYPIKMALEIPKFKPNYIGSKRIKYDRDDKPLFPTVERNININSLKYLVNLNTDQKLKKLNKKSNFEKFIIFTSLISIFVLFSTIFISNNWKIKRPISFDEKIKEGVSFVFDSYLKGIRENYRRFENNLASVSLSSDQESLAAWIKNTVYEVIKLWSKKDEPILVDNSSQSYFISENTCISREQLQALLLSIQQESAEVNTATTTTFQATESTTPTTSSVIIDDVIQTNSIINAQ